MDRIEKLECLLAIALEEAFPAQLNYSDRYKQFRLQAAEKRLNPGVQLLDNYAFSEELQRVSGRRV
jgi:hypothetical protein